MKFEKAKIYGVDQVGRQDPLDLPRTDDAVGLTVTVGTSEIHSDFDNCYPWSDMEEIVDSAGNVFVKIPKFYWKISKNEDGTYKHQISGVRYDGFGTLFIDGMGDEIPYVLVGKYEGSGSSSRVYSRSGQTVLVKTIIDSYRTGCRANGAGYQQYDFLIDMIIKELWLVEMATTNSQSIMYGYANANSAAIITGSTNSVATPSGSPSSNTDGKHAMKYRGIENLWGNTFTWCDGINFLSERIFICTDPDSYKSGSYTPPYVYQGDKPSSSGYISKVEPLDKNHLLVFISSAIGTDSTYYSDYHYYSLVTGLRVGGDYVSGSRAGLWCAASIDSANIYAYGCRLCFKPINGAEII